VVDERVVPAAFIGHGSPMNALEHNRFTDAWAAFGADLPPVRAVLAISAHWFIATTAVTAMDHPRTIHDFAGFPDTLTTVAYRAPGDPALADTVATLLHPTPVVLDTSSWGLDHGTWSVLRHVLPDADVPVVQLSIDATADVDTHVALGARLLPLRSDGVLVLGSGNVVHNLGRMDWSRPIHAFDWTQRFDDRTREIMTTDPATIGEVLTHPDAARAVPTPEHFLPLAYVAGLASAANTTARVLVDGSTYGSVSMTSYVVDG
jgi:4,5-DOPA dioxygenase extradiol